MTFRDVVSLCAGQQDMMQVMQNTIQANKAELEQKIGQKADVQDVSNAITEVIMTVDTRKDIEKLKKNLDQNDKDVKGTSRDKDKISSLMEGFRQEMNSLLARLQTLENSGNK